MKFLYDDFPDVRAPPEYADSTRALLVQLPQHALKQKYSVTVEEYGMTFESGTLAKQANGAVTIQVGETTVFVAATAANSIREGQDWFPLQVDYREKFSAAGRMPGQ